MKDSLLKLKRSNQVYAILHILLWTPFTLYMTLSASVNSRGHPLPVILSVVTFLEFCFAVGNLVFYSGSDEDVTNRAFNLGGWVKTVLVINTVFLMGLAAYMVMLTVGTAECRGRDCAILQVVVFFAWVYFVLTWAFMYMQSLYFHKYICEVKRVNSNPVHQALLVM